MRKILVPFHMYRLKDKIVGMDAYFWDKLDKKYRIVLLVHPSQAIKESAEGCRLPVDVSVNRQLSDLEDVAGIEVEKPRLPRISLSKRILTLLMPASLIYYEIRRGLQSFRVPEEVQAKGLAKILVETRPEPLGYVSYAVFRAEGKDLILPEQEGSMRRIYSELASRDSGYREACRHACRVCGW